jgi:hypothetical protein
MANVARLTDTTTGVCSIDGPQPGTITTSASNVYVDGKLVARATDTVTAACGHTGTIDDNGREAYAENQKIARHNDTFSGTYSGTIDDPSTTTKEG